ncbi:MAG TPA: aldo/keto reductase [Thermoanaerobaculia bacterium]|nr:aldo/keto reductase [Thermoanaerobaculia bacterium]
MADSHDDKIERRDILKIGAAATVGLLARDVGAAIPPSLPNNPVTSKAMPTRNLGRTGYRVGIFSLGGQAAIEQPDNEAVAVPIIDRALDLGVNYIDTSARYGGEARWSERYVGQVMKRRRREAFLASKTHDRTRDGSLRLLEKSLQLLNTDHLDLWQLHAVSTKDDIDRIFAPGGAIEALTKAREEKIVRFVGITGHADPDVLLEGIRRFPFDTILMAVNAADPHHMSFSAELLPAAVEKEMGIIGMKIPARGRILSTWTPPPLEKQPARYATNRSGTLTMAEAMRYVLSHPVSTVIVGVDTVAQLEQNVEIARTFTPLSASQMAALSAKAEPVKKQSLFFRPWPS